MKFAISLLLLAALPAFGATVDTPVSSSGLSVSVDTGTGAYTVSATQSAWTFRGSLGQPLNAYKAQQGKDRIGPYDEITFRWTDGGPVEGSIRNYRDRPVVLFSEQVLTARAAPPAPFPSFTTLPENLHPLSFENTNFSPVRFRLIQTSTPCLLYDNRDNAAIVSPASHFMVAKLTGDGTATLSSGLNEDLHDLPKGFSQETLVAFGQGINHTWDVWGQALTDLQGKKRPAYDGDLYTKDLGYWTDNGAAYYYDYDQSLGYAGTLLAVRKRYEQLGIPINYLQLDSWWYEKTTVDAKGRDEGKPKNSKLPAGTWNAYGGLTLYKAHPFLFPNGLAAFQKELGLPLATHNRWIDVNSPYRQQYRISGVGAVDPKWWDDVMTYLTDSGVTMYEQDWLNVIYDNSPEFRTTTWAGDAFMDNMARAAREHRMSLQYCMGQPRHFLQGSKYDNLTTIRVSDDRFKRSDWRNFLFTSRMASALGEWPWVDVFRSKETENFILCTLSAGMVGLADAMGEEDTTNIFRAVRTDGVIVKPDQPIVPTDETYLAGEAADPITAWTQTDHGPRRTLYVFTFLKKAGSAGEVRFRPANFGLAGAAYVYDWFLGRGQRVGPGEEYREAIPLRGSAYYIVAPVGESGIAFLGDMGKFASTGKQRIASIEETPESLTAKVLFAPGEGPVTLHGFAAKPVVATCRDGVVGTPTYDGTGHFTVKVAPKGKVVSVTLSH